MHMGSHTQLTMKSRMTRRNTCSDDEAPPRAAASMASSSYEGSRRAHSRSAFFFLLGVLVFVRDLVRVRVCEGASAREECVVAMAGLSTDDAASNHPPTQPRRTFVLVLVAVAVLDLVGTTEEAIVWKGWRVGGG